MLTHSCTKAEREYLDAKYAYDLSHAMGDYDRVVEAHTAVLAERRAAEQGSVTPTNEVHEDEYARQRVENFKLNSALRAISDRETRIAELEAALAEELAKPKEGAVRYEVNANDHGDWCVNSAIIQGAFREHHAKFTGPDAERHAREHAARLQAEHDAKAGQP